MHFVDLFELFTLFDRRKVFAVKGDFFGTRRHSPASQTLTQLQPSVVGSAKLAS